MHPVQAPSKLLGEDIQQAKVSTLTDSNTKWWHIQPVNTLFNPRVAAEIFKIMLSPTLMLIGKYGMKKRTVSIV